ncbi:DUF4381 domain-containing protein [Marinobacter sp.]|uniref:DUF4381 domain-containing protein n=1 Tax=Marinobacter sp. TaxID=50741 RepID=UPI003851798F
MENDPLSQLRDIHLPQPGGFWPPAPGWWLVAGVTVALSVALALWLFRRHKRNRWIATAREELSQIHHSDLADSEKLAELNRLLKRAARRRYPEHRPESLSGDAWIAFLTRTSLADGNHLEPVFRDLAQSSWHPRPGVAFAEAEHAVRAWLGQQKC